MGICGSWVYQSLAVSFFLGSIKYHGNQHMVMMMTIYNGHHFMFFFKCCWYTCGCRSSQTHTHRCDNISFWNLRIVKACASVICDSPIKVDAKDHHQLVKFTQDCCQSLFYMICDNPTKVDATGHHHNVIYCRSKALSFQSLAPATYKSCACHGFFLRPQFRGVICMGLPMPRTCNAHAAHMQHTCNTHATHMQHTCNTHATRAFSL